MSAATAAARGQRGGGRGGGRSRPPGVAQTSPMEDRFLFALYSLIGQQVEVTTKSGAVYIGFFHTSAPKAGGLGIVLQMPRLKGSATTTVSTKPLIIDAAEFASLEAHEAEFSDTGHVMARTGALATDADISGGAQPHLMGRRLEAANAWLHEDTSVGGLEDDSHAAWDQFAENKKKFQINATFDENQYTTALNVQQFSHAQQQKAAALAREIEGKATRNIHVAEERNQVIPAGVSEEDLYGAVVRTAPSRHAPGTAPAASDRYVPPARRKQGGVSYSSIVSAGGRKAPAPAAAAGAAAAPAAPAATTPAATSAAVAPSTAAAAAPAAAAPAPAPTPVVPASAPVPATAAASAAPAPAPAAASAQPAPSVAATAGVASAAASASAPAAAAAAAPAPPAPKSGLSAKSKLNPNAKTFQPKPMQALPMQPPHQQHPQQQQHMPRTMPMYGYAPNGYAPMMMQPQYMPQQQQQPHMMPMMPRGPHQRMAFVRGMPPQGAGYMPRGPPQ